MALTVGLDYGARTVTVRADVSDGQAVKTLCHELAHIQLGHEIELREFGCRGRHEVEAESVAYVVSAFASMTTDGYSLPYVAHWAAGDMATVRQTAEKVLRATGRILEATEATR